MIIDNDLKKRLKKQLLEKIKAEARGRIIIQTPFKPTSEELESLSKFLNPDKSVETINEINKDIIGGFIIKHGSAIIDASIKSRIEKLVLTISK